MRSLRYGTSALTGTRAIVCAPQNGGTGTGTPRFSSARRSRISSRSTGRSGRGIGGAAELAASG